MKITAIAELLLYFVVGEDVLYACIHRVSAGVFGRGGGGGGVRTPRKFLLRTVACRKKFAERPTPLPLQAWNGVLLSNCVKELAGCPGHPHTCTWSHPDYAHV